MYQKHLRTVLSLLLISLALAGSFSSCIREDLGPCSRVAVRVSLDPLPSQDKIEEKEVRKVTLYVFDEHLLLLETRETELHKPEYLDYPNRDLHVVALINTLGRERITEPGLKEAKEKGEISLLPGDPYYGLKPFLTTGDLMWGEIELNTFPATKEEVVIDLPVRRITAGVLVRLYGLEAYARRQGWAEPFVVVLESKYEKVDFSGQTYTPDAGEVHYTPLLQPGDTRYGDFYECPGQDFGGQYVHLLATDDPSRIEVHLYSAGEKVYSTADDDTGYEGELNIENGRMHLIDITFRGGGEGGTIEVEIEQPTWTVIPLPVIF